MVTQSFWSGTKEELKASSPERSTAAATRPSRSTTPSGTFDPKASTRSRVGMFGWRDAISTAASRRPILVVVTKNLSAATLESSVSSWERYWTGTAPRWRQADDGEEGGGDLDGVG